MCRWKYEMELGEMCRLIDGRGRLKVIKMGSDAGRCGAVRMG